MSLAALNALDDVSVREHLGRCCHSRAWVEAMAAARPFADLNAALATSDEATRALDNHDLAEAFAGHPRIGERSTSAWSTQEQSGVDAGLQDQLIAANREYEARFGHVFLIKATGRSGEEILAECRRRLANDPQAEINEAREQLMLINQIRISKLIDEVE